MVPSSLGVHPSACDVCVCVWCVVCRSLCVCVCGVGWAVGRVGDEGEGGIDNDGWVVGPVCGVYHTVVARNTRRNLWAE